MCLICQRIEMIKEGSNPYLVKELSTGYVVLGDHQYFKGYTLFLAKQHVRELHDLDPETRLAFLAEMSQVQEAVAKAFGAEKMNVELLGNGDAHLHWHLFPRRAGDMGTYGHQGRGPVWWVPFEEMTDEAVRLQEPKLSQMRQMLLEALEG